MKKEFKRMWFVMVVTIILISVFISGVYESLPPVIQLVLSKLLLVTAGVIAAHILRKFLFPPIVWTDDNNWQLTVAVVAFYMIIIYCFAMGG
ncbi:hypothetical protein [Sulfuricurvum sp.]|uniref:hypothetical protein n=1 Tax=Sulfuricurvum sp. TaxID=2025608 RepID=UPI003BB22341